MSVPSTSVAQATFAATLVDEWVRHGLREVVVCPGSRSTPIVLAAVAREDLTVHVRIDERSAGFFAIGCARRSNVPVAVVVTSGTAAMELHASVAEAHHDGVPLLVATADRPPELHDVGALQTTRQRELFGSLVSAYAEPGVARWDARTSWRPLASRLFRAALVPGPGPVHVNLAFVEPFAATGDDAPIARDGPWVRQPENLVVTVPAVSGAVLVVAGPGASPAVLDAARSRGWVVVGDATTTGARPYVDAIVSHEAASAALRPSVVVRTGGLPASKNLLRVLRDWGRPVVAVSGARPVADPDGIVTHVGVAPESCGDDASDYGARWDDAVKLVRSVAESLDEPTQMLSEPSVARVVGSLSADRAVPLVVGSSMPLRDVEWWTEARGTTYANRGLNGIDGVVSTALGVAASSSAIGLVGDVTFLHDVSGLVDGLGGPGRCALVVVDNGGGGIFAFLPQRTTVGADAFSRIFATPRGHDLVAVARGFGHAAERVTTNEELRTSVGDALGREGLSVLVARVPHYEVNVTLHEELNDLARRALSDHFA